MELIPVPVFGKSSNAFNCFLSHMFFLLLSDLFSYFTGNSIPEMAELCRFSVRKGAIFIAPFGCICNKLYKMVESFYLSMFKPFGAFRTSRIPVKIKINCQATNETIKMLNDNELDLGLIAKPKSMGNLHFEPLMKIKDTLETEIIEALINRKENIYIKEIGQTYKQNRLSLKYPMKLDFFLPLVHV